MKIRIKNPIWGVQITFLYSYTPEQFEIVALGNSRENFTPTKDYINPKKHMTNGNICNGNAINQVLAINTKIKQIKTYYTSDNSDYLIAPYARILIQKKNENNTKKNIGFKILGITKSWDKSEITDSLRKKKKK